MFRLKRYFIILIIFNSLLYSDSLPLEKELNKYINWAEKSMKNSPKNNRFSGWEVKPLIDTMLHAYSISNEKYYLEKTSSFIKYFLNTSSYSLNEKNYNGKIEKKWHRLDRYNIFSVSPYKKYNLKDKKRLMKKRHWKSLNFSDVNYSGLFLEPMLRFVEIVQNKKIKKYNKLVTKIILFSQQNFEQHEKEWIFIDKIKGGYYIFPKNSPFFLDGVEMPINEAAIYGSFLMRLYNITNDIKYLNRSKMMINRWIPYFTNINDMKFSYPYVVGDWYRGSTNISINTPNLIPEKGAEVFHKSASTLDFLIRYNNVVKGKVKHLIDSFRVKVNRVFQAEKNIVAFYPNKMDNIFPKDTYHSKSVFKFTGIGFGDVIPYNSTIYKMGYLDAYVDVKLDKVHSLATLYNLFYKLENKFQVKKKTIQIKPFKLNNGNLQHCMIYENKDYIGIVNYQHMFPKTNRLYLYDVFDGAQKRVRLDIKDGKYFQGIIYIPAKKCINLKWFYKNKNSLPKHKDEEEIKIDLFKLTKKYND